MSCGPLCQRWVWEDDRRRCLWDIVWPRKEPGWKQLYFDQELRTCHQLGHRCERSTTTANVWLHLRLIDNRFSGSSKKITGCGINPFRPLWEFSGDVRVGKSKPTESSGKCSYSQHRIRNRYECLGMVDVTPTFALPERFLACLGAKFLFHCDLHLLLTDYYKERLESRLESQLKIGRPTHEWMCLD